MLELELAELGVDELGVDEAARLLMLTSELLVAELLGSLDETPCALKLLALCNDWPVDDAARLEAVEEAGVLLVLGVLLEPLLPLPQFESMNTSVRDITKRTIIYSPLWADLIWGCIF